jgi:hypothetical protein
MGGIDSGRAVGVIGAEFGEQELRGRQTSGMAMSG